MTDTSASTKGLIAWLWRHYLRARAGWLLAATLLMVMEGAMFGALSYMMKPMFDDVFVGGNASALGWVALLVFAVFATRAIAGVLQKTLLGHISQHVMGEMRSDMLGHLMTLDSGFHQSNPPGALLQRIDGDTTVVARVWNEILTGAIRDIAALISLFGVAFLIDWTWTVTALVGVPLLIAPAWAIQRMIRGNARSARVIAARMSTRLDEVFHGIVPVKLNRIEDLQLRRYDDLTQERIRTEVRTIAGAALIPGLIDIMSGIGFLGVMFLGASDILAGEKTVGDFMAFFTAIGLAFEPLRRLGAMSGVWQTAAPGIERIRDILSVSSKIKDPARPLAPPEGVPDVVLRDVSLHYGDTQILDGLTLTAKAGQTTALVGPSGAGKSTVFNLLTRLVDPDSGQALVGETPVDQMRLSDLRELFSVVSQDALLFDESLRDNILLGEDATDAQLTSALKAAHVEDFLPRLEHGIDSPAGPRGSTLSGGQRQRVAIARAILRDRPVLLLDEATSALDPRSEALVQKALDALSQGRTTLVIAHRLSTIRGADTIYVMDKGRVTERGTHAELLEQNGTYAALWRMQSQE
ncbi:MAG: ABC transporter ATP-binding protein [Pseudoprimorskyibacter sp.]|nr:ABC transporter ATP-binding protein [Pseudoprimorskyibacter sp.]